MKNIILIILLSISFDISSQVSISAANEMKYWKLRGRLLGDERNRGKYNGFLQVGAGAGMSIPSEQRYPIYGRQNGVFNPLWGGPGYPGGCADQKINGINVWPNQVNGVITNPLIDPRDGREMSGIQNIGDNPIISIGQYLGVLATEWELLHRSSQSTTKTEMEMYYALLALDRLDLKGETLYGGAPDNNGFLMRSDVQADFELNNTGQNIYLVISPTACTDYEPDCEMSKTTNHTSNAMSQDEMAGMLLGMSLIHKFMPYYASYNGIGLKQWSEEITSRVVKYVKKGGTTNWWLITDPVDGNPVCRGPMAIVYSYAYAKAAHHICGGNFQNIISATLGHAMWEVIKNAYYANNIANLVITLAIPPFLQSALNINSPFIFKPGGKIFGKKTGAHNINMFLKMVTCSRTGARPYLPFLDFTGKTLINSVSQNYKKEFYELLGSVMSGYQPKIESFWW